MDLSPHINQLREDLTSAASAGDESTRNAAALLSGALEPAMRLTLMNALSDLAAEVTTQLDGRVVDLRLDGRDVHPVISGPATTRTDGQDEQPPQPPPSAEGGDISRITLRLLEEIKGQAEQAASSQGVSLNTWVARAVQGALHGSKPRGPWDRTPSGDPSSGNDQAAEEAASEGSRLHGWVRG
ncbi:toxin-antitoxin system HicB family antitoxin [Actinopolyspora saharensis]|uniref:HicB family protein n=1 Tax=Actinopolyspora saharensis TaxID=995062 RepID=A0A1H1AV42_9ACTN|nr:toxin-antitoxin system HicB family antitoxin [Actinopolyspora saharensis]SDQ43520.1 HicB family protein [Actinopolyspora saharensis]